MNKKLLAGAVTTALGLSSFGAQAITDTSLLTFNAGAPIVTGCLVGGFIASTQTCTLGTAVNVTDMGGSYFAMDTITPDLTFQPAEKVSMTQLGDGVALGAADGIQVDQTWIFGGPSGFHYNSTAFGTGMYATSSNTIDMQGWTVNYGAEGDVNMGTGADAVLTCSDGVTCGIGATYTLDYTATVPTGGFAGVFYGLHLEGTIGEQVAAVPVPAAVWLFGSGLLGLVGVARRKARA